MFEVRHAAGVSITSTPIPASVSARAGAGAESGKLAPVPSSTSLRLQLGQRREIGFGQRSKPPAVLPVAIALRASRNVVTGTRRRRADVVRAVAGEHVSLGGYSVELHFNRVQR